jgi:acyl carrier protein
MGERGGAALLASHSRLSTTRLQPPAGMTTDEAIIAELTKLVAEELGLPVTALRGEMRIDTLGLDSLAFVEMIVAIEQRLGVQMNSDRLPDRIPPDISLDAMLKLILGGFNGRLR